MAGSPPLENFLPTPLAMGNKLDLKIRTESVCALNPHFIRKTQVVIQFFANVNYPDSDRKCIMLWGFCLRAALASAPDLMERSFQQVEFKLPSEVLHKVYIDLYVNVMQDI